jgi:DNA replication protein DnaC
MLNHPTINHLKIMKLDGMAQAFSEQLELNGSRELSFEERFALLIDREIIHRENKRFTRKLSNAKLKQAATLEDIDYQHPRNLDPSFIQNLSNLDWMKQKHNLIITGPTGVGKTFLACAFAHQACRKDFTAYYAQTNKLLQDMAMAKHDGRYFRLLNKLSKTSLLILDDWGLDSPDAQERRILLEILDDRYQRASTIIASQFPTNLFYDNLNDPTLADAILDRVLHNAYKIQLKGESLRKTKNTLTQPTPNQA